MDTALPQRRDSAEQDRRILDAIRKLRPRLGNFIRRRVAAEDVEDILQEVFAELVEAERLTTPIEEVGAWLFRVARNRIIDRFRKQRPEQFPSARADTDALAEERALPRWEETLPSPDAGPDAAFARRILLEEIDHAVAELPPAQREVFVAHEIDGLSFKEIAAATGINMNTLLARKRYAVLFLRRRLQAIHDTFSSQ
ncbi:MAG TPA: RNA polymerase sigma factor [Stellaceae bacterium]|jgi:RNA polymerase sigma factor (sigma-70 family)|nr:RNA polymerase sigma factor [Stellaceae bacterium]